MQYLRQANIALRSELQLPSQSQNLFQSAETPRTISHPPVNVLSSFLVLPHISSPKPVSVLPPSASQHNTNITASNLNSTRRGGNRGLCKTCGHEKSAFKELHTGRGFKCQNPNIAQQLPLPCPIAGCFILTNHFHECTCEKCRNI